MDTSNQDEFSYFQYSCSFVISSVFGSESSKEFKRFRKTVLKQKRNEDQFKLLFNHLNIERELNKFRDNLKLSTKKCKLIAAEKMKFGHEAFDAKNFEEALAFYTEAILYLPFPKKNEADELWSQCFLHRALVYFRLELYSYCGEDFDEAINHTADSRQKVLLICFKVYASKLAKTGDQKLQDDLDLSITNPNDKMLCMSDDLELVVTENKGRTLMAKNRIENGTLLVTQTPIVAWLRPSFWSTHCNHCLKQLNNRCVPCRSCSDVRYCSWKCGDNAWQSYHRIECKLSPSLKNMVYGTLGLRVVIIYGVDNVLNYYKNGETVDWTETRLDDGLKSVMSLVHEMQTKDDKFEFEVIIGTALMAKIAESLGLIRSSSPYLLRFCSALKLCIFKVLMNCFYIYDESVKMTGDIITYESEYKDVGFSVYSSSSMFCHSCNCNANRMFHGSQIYIYSNQDINASQEVTLDYGTDIHRNSYRYRQAFLKNSFGFDCGCKACSDKLENINYAVRCPECKGSLIMNRLDEEDLSHHCLSCGATDLKIRNILKQIEEGDKYLRKGDKKWKKDETSKAKKYLKISLKAYKDAYFNEVPLKEAYALLSSCYFSECRYSKAFENCMEALKITETLNGKYSFEYVDQLLNLIDIAIHENDEKKQYLKRNDLDSVKTCFEEAINLLTVLKKRKFKLANSRHVRYFASLEGFAKRLNYSHPLVSFN